MKRIITFIKKVLAYKVIGIYSPSNAWLGIDLRKKSLKWYWEQSCNEFNAWRV